jgi:hypothetical protein
MQGFHFSILLKWITTNLTLFLLNECFHLTLMRLNFRGFWATIPIMRIWTSRLFIAIVTAWNLQAAFVFIFSPVIFVNGFELSGIAGESAVRGFGVLFLMWNIPYIVALWNPIQHKLTLVVAVTMQFVGLIGESYILSTISTEHIILRTSILRFIAFDGTGLFLLIFAWFLVKQDHWLFQNT